MLTPRIVRVRFAPNGTFSPRRSWAVATPDDDTATFPTVPFSISETPTKLTIQMAAAMGDPAMTIHIQRSPCRISFTDHTGQVFCAEEQGHAWNPSPGTIHNRWHAAATFHMAPGEHFFGTGQRTGYLNKRGRKLVNWTTDPGTSQGPTTDPLYIAIPIMLSVRPGLSYGIFINNTWASSFDLGHDDPDIWRMEVEGGELDYYVIYGPSPAEVNAGIGKVCGTMPLPPRWSLGYHQSRWSYAPESRVREIAQTFRQRDIPCDVIHLDIAYMDGYRVFTWNSERFPDPPRLIADLRDMGFRSIAIVDPSIKKDSNFPVYQESIERNMVIRRSDGTVFEGYMWPDDSVFGDFTRPDVRQWWGDWQRRLVDQGISGIWNDMNEPPIFDTPFSQEVGKRTWGTIDLDAIQGPPDEQTTHAEVHNLFGYGMAQASYDGLRRARPNERPFVLTRAAFAGIQRWSACWMGDNSSTWEHLEMAMPQLMNIALSGVPFVGVDIGGFAGNASGELFARWMQMGILSPFCRGHTTHFSRDQEPYAFGQEVEDICRTYLELRYRLMPYLYTLFWEASERGTPVLRPLFYHYPDDPTTYTLHDQVMLGSFLMAAPIYQPGRTCRAVFLPAGEWYDWWTGERHTGPCHILAQAPLDTLPLYVRGGAIIPTGPTMCYTDEHPLNPLTLDLYPGNGCLTLYEDDGHSFAYEQGEFCTTTYQLEEHEGEGKMRLTIAARQGGFTPPSRRLIIHAHHAYAVRQQQASACSQEAQYDLERSKLTLELDDDGQAQEYIFLR